jgi:hypothetical protein
LFSDRLVKFIKEKEQSCFPELVGGAKVVVDLALVSARLCSDTTARRPCEASAGEFTNGCLQERCPYDF